MCWKRERGDEVGRERVGMAKARNSGFNSRSRVSGLGKQSSRILGWGSRERRNAKRREKMKGMGLLS